MPMEYCMVYAAYVPHALHEDIKRAEYRTMVNGSIA